MLWVYCHYYCLNSFSVGTAFRRPNLTSTDSPRDERVNTLRIISDVIAHHKKYILNHHLLRHTLYEMFFRVEGVNISLSYVCTIKSEIGKNI